MGKRAMRTTNLDLVRGVGCSLAERAAKKTAMRTGLEKPVYELLFANIPHDIVEVRRAKSEGI